jgi:hypothetical protein
MEILVRLGPLAQLVSQVQLDHRVNVVRTVSREIPEQRVQRDQLVTLDKLDSLDRLELLDPRVRREQLGSREHPEFRDPRETVEC